MVSVRCWQPAAVCPRCLSPSPRETVFTLWLCSWASCLRREGTENPNDGVRNRNMGGDTGPSSVRCLRAEPSCVYEKGNRAIFLSDAVASQFSAPVKRSTGVNNQRHSQSAQPGARPGPVPLPPLGGRPPTEPPCCEQLGSAPQNSCQRRQVDGELTMEGREQIQRECHPFDGMGPKSQRLLIHCFISAFIKSHKSYLWKRQIGNQSENEDRKPKMSTGIPLRYCGLQTIAIKRVSQPSEL